MSSSSGSSGGSSSSGNSSSSNSILILFFPLKKVGRSLILLMGIDPYDLSFTRDTLRGHCWKRSSNSL